MKISQKTFYYKEPNQNYFVVEIYFYEKKNCLLLIFIIKLKLWLKVLNCKYFNNEHTFPIKRFKEGTILLLPHSALLAQSAQFIFFLLIIKIKNQKC